MSGEGADAQRTAGRAGRAAEGRAWTPRLVSGCPGALMLLTNFFGLELPLSFLVRKMATSITGEGAKYCCNFYHVHFLLLFLYALT